MISSVLSRLLLSDMVIRNGPGLANSSNRVTFFASSIVRSKTLAPDLISIFPGTINSIIELAACGNSIVSVCSAAACCTAVDIENCTCDFPMLGSNNRTN